MKARILIWILALIAPILFPSHASAAITWSVDSKTDSTYDGDDYNAKYDLDSVSVAIWDNDPDEIYFYMYFNQVPTAKMFNDGLGSWAFIGLDYDMDGTRDIRLVASKVTLPADLYSVDGVVEDTRIDKDLNCQLDIFANLAAGKKWIGFTVSRKCIKLPSTFDVFGYAQFNSNNQNLDSYDYAPYPFFRVSLPGTTPINPTTSTSSAAASGSTYIFPSTLANSSRDSTNFSSVPANLANLSGALLPSVVTVKCAKGSGTGWSADVELSQTLKTAGFKSLIITNHHVIEDCLGNKSVSLVLSTGATVSGQVISWNASSDVAGIATSSVIPALQWIGSAPQQGWWVGVLGSPLGTANILTTGIISSVNPTTRKFTLTAAINPGNSGGPVFDNTGRVLGLATSKAVLSDGQLAEGFGTAQGAPLLCKTVVTCLIEEDPWNAKAKFAATSEVTDNSAKAAAEKAAAEKAAADQAAALIKQRDEMKVRCIAFNGDLEIAIFNVKNAENLYPKSKNIFTSLVKNAPISLDCSSINTSTFDAELQSREKILIVFETASQSAIKAATIAATSKTTITCIKGKAIKKVTAVNPKCPTGYKKK